MLSARITVILLITIVVLTSISRPGSASQASWSDVWCCIKPGSIHLSTTEDVTEYREKYYKILQSMSMCYRLLKIYLSILNCQKVLQSNNTRLHLLPSTGYKPTSPNASNTKSTRRGIIINAIQVNMCLELLQLMLTLILILLLHCYCSITKSTCRVLIINAN